jgi:UDP-N-acetyl-D-mannosaminuronate dehydrogenase
VQEAIEAANTQPYSHVHTPGIGVGGHCILVYPHFLTWDAPSLLLPRVARAVKGAMPSVATKRLEQEMGSLAGRRVLVLGLAYRGGVREDAFTPAVPLVAALLRRLPSRAGRSQPPDPWTARWCAMYWDGALLATSVMSGKSKRN